jgi:Flp pilus assembly protein TadG
VTSPARSARPSSRFDRADAGSAVVEFVWLGWLLLIPLVYLIVTFFEVQQSAYGVTQAARSAGRAYILAPDRATAERRAYEAARIALADQDVDLRRAELTIVCLPTPDSCLRPNSSVEIRIALQVPLPLAPALGESPAASVSVAASHTEPFGTYREARP